jgi:hypothetical protein
MSARRQFTVHIATPAGARFSIHDSKEDMRTSLIEYYNEVHAGNLTYPIPDDYDLADVIDEIEEFENVSWEEVWLPPQKVWVLVEDDAAGGTSVDLFKTEREALESVAATYEIPIDGLTNGQARVTISRALDTEHNASWFVLEEKEIPA